MFIPKTKINMGEIDLQSSVKIVGIIIFFVFIVELLLMATFHTLFRSISPMAESILDAALLALLLFPILYFFLSKSKSAEKVLKLKEDKLKAILDSMADGIYMVNHLFEIEYINPVLEKEFGPIKGRRCFEYFHDRKEACPWCKNPEVFSGKSVRWEWHSFKADKTYDLFDTPIRNIDGSISKLEVFHDVTEQGRAKEEIQRHFDIEASINTLLRLSLEDTPLDKLMEDALRLILSIQWLAFESSGSIFLVEDEPGVLVMKASKGLSESLQKSCSRVPFGKCLCGLTGATREIQFADCCDERHEIHHDGMTPHGHYCVPILFGESVLGVINIYLKEGHFRDKKEEEFLATIANTLTGVIIRRTAEESMRDSEERYRRLLGSVTDYIYTVKVENGFPVSTLHGPGCVAVTGYTSEEYESDPNLWYRMVCEEDRKAVIGQSANVLSGKDVHPLEHRIIHRDGSIRWVRNTPVPRYNEEGRLVAYDGLISDITERRCLEEQLHHSQKIEVVGTLAGGIAHAFNNILTAMMGYASLLKMEIKSDGPSSHHVEQILVLAEKAANLAQGLLAFSRKQIIHPKPTDLDETIKRMEMILPRLIGEDIELKTILAEKKLAVMADSGQIEQVLMNLCVNARDAMPGGGSLTIESGFVKLSSEYTKKHGYGAPGDYYMISVADTGTGMDENAKERIFEPFFTTKELGKGTGLGLSIAYGIIKQHNGYINVSSELGKGTRFDIYLPLIEPAEVGEKRSQGQISLAGGTETILYAEDELFLREATKEVFEEFGYKVIAAVDGEDAIDKFMKNRDDIHLVLLDAVMPKKNGNQVYEEIRKIRPDIKVVFLSGYVADALKNQNIAGEGLTLISKPVFPDELLKKIREVLDK